MSPRMTINGVSTCTKAGTEKYEKFQTGIGRRKRTLVQYDYRHTDGELFYGKKIIMESQRLIIPCNQLDIPITLHFGFP